MMDKDEFNSRFREEFDCTSEERDKMIVQAEQLNNSGIYEKGNLEGNEFTIDDAISSMKAAPNHLSVTGKWSWWMGVLNASDDDYGRFKY